MGFGFLFLGCIFLLNIAYPGFTDLLAALLLLLGLVRLSGINRGFRIGCGVAFGFALLGLLEFVRSALDLFGLAVPVATDTVLSLLRHPLVGATEFFILFGISIVAKEVGLPKLCVSAQSYYPLPFVCAVAQILFEIPGLLPVGAATNAVAVAVVLLDVVFTVLLLFLVYHCYAQICMPEDANMPEKPSRFAFVNRYRERQKQKNAEVAEYRRQQFLSKKQKKKGRKS